MFYALFLTGCYTDEVEGVLVEVPFPPSEVLQILVALCRQREVQAPSKVSERDLIVVKLLAPLEVMG